MALTLLGEHEREHERQHEQSAGGKLTSAEALHGPWAEGKGQRGGKGQRATGKPDQNVRGHPLQASYSQNSIYPSTQGVRLPAHQLGGPLGQSRLTAHRGRPHRPDSRHGRTGQHRPGRARRSITVTRQFMFVRSFAHVHVHAILPQASGSSCKCPVHSLLQSKIRLLPPPKRPVADLAVHCIVLGLGH